jgi:lipopolysaccharide export LptBFGC system permease protein LptF
MWRLHRYYLRELAINAGITFLVLFAVVLTSLVYRGIDKSQGGGLLDAAKIMMLFALDSFPHLLTIAFLIATVMTFTRAAQDRELTAVRAAGISPRTPLMAAFLIGLLLTAVGSFTIHYVIPWVHFHKYRVIAEVVRNAFISLRLGSDRIPLLDTGYLMTFREQKRGGDFRDCVIYCPKPIDTFRSPILFADRVAIPPLADHAEGGTIRIEVEGLRDPIGEGVPLSRHLIDIPLEDFDRRGRREERDDDLRSDQLLAEVMRGVHRKPHEAVYTLFRRCCFSLMPVVLAPMGFCLAELARERGRVTALLLTLVPLTLFYLGEVLGARLLVTTQSPWVAWLPMGFLLVVGVPLCWRQLRR